MQIWPERKTFGCGMGRVGLEGDGVVVGGGAEGSHSEKEVLESIGSKMWEASLIREAGVWFAATAETRTKVLQGWRELSGGWVG